MWCLATTIAVRLLKESTASQDALNRLQQCARCADARAIVPARPAFEMRCYFAHLLLIIIIRAVVHVNVQHNIAEAIKGVNVHIIALIIAII